MKKPKRRVRQSVRRKKVKKGLAEQERQRAQALELQRHHRVRPRPVGYPFVQLVDYDVFVKALKRITRFNVRK